ncbi:MAG: transposase [Alphaproteobacteria bacterium]|nr:transposase [Alphaproteobacteria bacterium]
MQQDAHAVVLIDGAGWHKEDNMLRVPENITLVRFPPYSPELNAQKNIWEYLRPNFPAAKVCDTCNDIVDACCIAWNELLAILGKTKSIALPSWLQIEQIIT